MAAMRYVDRAIADAAPMISQEATGRLKEIPATVRWRGVTLEGAGSRSGQLCLTAGGRVRGRALAGDEDLFLGSALRCGASSLPWGAG